VREGNGSKGRAGEGRGVKGEREEGGRAKWFTVLGTNPSDDS